MKACLIIWGILSIIFSALSSLAAPTLISAADWIQVVIGVILIIAVVLDWLLYIWSVANFLIKKYGDK